MSEVESSETMLMKRITTKIRQDIFDFLTGENHWAGNLEDYVFLARLYNLSALPSSDSRYSAAASDIKQHRSVFHDWNDDWILSDPRFNLQGVVDSEFLDFLVQVVHHKVRDVDSAVAIKDKLNQLLAPSRYELQPDYEQGSFLGTYSWGETTALQPSCSEVISETPILTDKAQLVREQSRIRDQLSSDPDAAIAESKNLLETLFKQILDIRGETYAKEDVPALYRKACAVIHAETVDGSSKASDSLRKTLRTLTNIVQAVAELRNELGNHHGTTVLSPAKPRHARLAFNAAITVAEYMVETLEAHQD